MSDKVIRVRIGYAGVMGGRYRSGNITVDRPPKWIFMTVNMHDAWVLRQVKNELGDWATFTGYWEV